jgi:hypothetical protein
VEATATSHVVVFGVPFSGCTTLAWSLAQHPRLTQALQSGAAASLVSTLEVLETEVLPFLLVSTADGAPQSPPGRARNPVADVLRGVAESLEPVDRSPTELRWVTGSSRLARHVPLLGRLLPEARFVHVRRDPADVVDHLVRSAASDGFALSTDGAQSIVARSAASCLDAERSIPGRALQIDYDALVEAPERALRSCLAFVGVRWHQRCLWPLRLLTSAPRRGSTTTSWMGRAPDLRSETVSLPPSADPEDSRGDVAIPVGHRRLRQLVESVTAEGSRVLVVSRGDEQLVHLRGRHGTHFPQVDGGTYAGHHPADGKAAVADLEHLRAAGATHLVLPRTGFWWLDHYPELREHLERRARLAACDLELGIVWELQGVRPRALPEVLSTFRRVPSEPDNQRAFESRHRDQPPKRRCRLGGTLWAVTTYFNPASYGNKAANYARFRAGLADADVPLLTVELAFGAASFELGTGDADALLQLRLNDVMWQKERLLNVGVAHLPPECDKVAWIDADVVFARSDWVQETSALLHDHVVVQPFSHCVRLERDQEWCEPAALPFGPGEGQLFYGIAWGVRAKGRASLARYDEHGHTGFAWAARRSLLEGHGLYDANLLGTGDTDIAHAMFGNRDYWGLRRLGAGARTHLERWATPFAAEVGGSVAYVDGVVTHLWHGNPQHRLYDRTLDVLLEFDPDRDLEVDSSTRLYRWAAASEHVQEWSRQYFTQRREEG